MNKNRYLDIIVLTLLLLLIITVNFSVVVADPEDDDYNCDRLCRWVCSHVRGKYNELGDLYYYNTYHRSIWPGWAIIKDWTFYGYDEYGVVIYADSGRLMFDSDTDEIRKTFYISVTFAETISKRYPACHGLDWVHARALIGPPGFQ